MTKILFVLVLLLAVAPSAMAYGHPWGAVGYAEPRTLEGYNYPRFNNYGLQQSYAPQVWWHDTSWNHAGYNFRGYTPVNYPYVRSHDSYLPQDYYNPYQPGWAYSGYNPRGSFSFSHSPHGWSFQTRSFGWNWY